jgi:hypothetical protein
MLHDLLRKTRMKSQTLMLLLKAAKFADKLTDFRDRFGSVTALIIIVETTRNLVQKVANNSKIGIAQVIEEFIF